MCGRYYVDEDTALEIEKIVINIDKKIRSAAMFRAHDIHPGDLAPVLVASPKAIELDVMKWGYPGLEGNKLIFNARCETVTEKRMFRESVVGRRIVVPAAGFYEWSRNKEKNTFCRKDRSGLFMAGIYNHYPEEDRFTILTTKANASMETVHDRMPLILEPAEVMSWLLDGTQTEGILKKTPELLERKYDYEQINLFQL